MDGEQLFALSRFCKSSGCHWRIQWQIYGESASTAGRIGSYIAGACTHHLPQFFPNKPALAIYWHKACYVKTHHIYDTNMNTLLQSLINEKQAGVTGQFYKDVIAGLKSTPKHLSSKYFYDANGDK